MTPMFFKAVKKPADKKKPAEQEKPVKDDGAKAAGAVDPSDTEYFSGLLQILAGHKVGGDFGPETVKAGHHVAFSAGSFTGAGKVSAVGQDGLTVSDASKREHRIHWREVTGHHAGDDQTGKAA